MKRLIDIGAPRRNPDPTLANDEAARQRYLARPAWQRAGLSVLRVAGTLLRLARELFL
jgi:hypothetical protein